MRDAQPMKLWEEVVPYIEMNFEGDQNKYGLKEKFAAGRACAGWQPTLAANLSVYGTLAQHYIIQRTKLFETTARVHVFN